MKNINYYYPTTYKGSLKTLLSSKLNLLNEPTNLESCLLILSSFCQIISQEEVLTFFKDVSASGLRSAIKREVDSGRLLGVTLYPHTKKEVDFDSRTDTGYMLTRKGFNYVQQAFRPDMKDSDYIKPATTKYNLHNYSLGTNLLLLLSCPFIGKIDDYETEVVNNLHRATQSVVEEDALRIDSKVRILGDTLYLEQDMGTEGIKELREKLAYYGYHTIKMPSKEHNIVVLSFKKPKVSLMKYGHTKDTSKIRFSKKAVKDTLTLVENTYRGEDISSFFLTELSNHSEDNANWQQALSLVADLKKHEYVNNEELSFNVNTYKDLKEHLEDFENYSSPMYMYEYNKIQEDFFVGRRNKLIESILSEGLSSRGSYDIMAYLSGYHFYACPTTMIDKLAFFMNLGNAEFREYVLDSLTNFIPSIDEDTYKPTFVISKDSEYKRSDANYTAPYCLVNTYRVPTGNPNINNIVSIENLTYDLSSVSRIRAAMESLNLERTDSAGMVMLVCLVKNKKEASYFYDLLQFKKLPLNGHLRVIFLDIEHLFADYDENRDFVLPEPCSQTNYPVYTFKQKDEKKILVEFKK